MGTAAANDSSCHMMLHASVPHLQHTVHTALNGSLVKLKSLPTTQFRLDAADKKSVKLRRMEWNKSGQLYTRVYDTIFTEN